MDPQERSVAQRNILERLAAKIPGISGYLEKETRRDTDRLLREFCAKSLFGQKDRVKSALDDVIAGGNLDGITPFEKLLNRLDVVAQQIRNAPRGYSGLFDTIKIGEETLQRVYEFDLKLSEAVSEIETKIRQIGQGPTDPLVTVKEATTLLAQVEDFFSKREEILRKGA